MAERCPERIPLSRLIGLADGELSARSAAKLERHLAGGCPVCPARLERIGRTVDSIAAGPLAAPPRNLLRGAGRLLAKHRRAATVSRVKRAVCRLLFDDRGEAAPALRSAPGRSRRMLFSVGSGELFLTFTRGVGSFTIEGEMLASVREVVLLREGRERDRAPVDADGRFAFRDLPRGAFSLAGSIEGDPFETPAIVF